VTTTEASVARIHRPLSTASTVLALVPHFRCEQWLAESLCTLVSQTRPLDGIVVIDDASPEPPVEIVADFPQVTLLRSNRNAGPFALDQEVIDKTAFDAFLFQDADDWCRDDRLAVSLEEAERSGAGIVATQAVRIDCEAGEATPTTFSYDVNARLLDNPIAHCLVLGAGVVSALALETIGGLATGLRVGADTELIQRAAHITRIVSVPDHCTFVRKRPGSLTTSAATGSGPIREAALQALQERALENVRRAAVGRPPLLEPTRAGPPVRLEHVLGPLLPAKPGQGRNDNWLKEPAGR
jgi:glycosyltransferase involved in cell wall biosynthesis